MERFHGGAAAKAAILSIVRQPRAFLKITILWSLVYDSVLVAHAAYSSLTTSTPFDVASDIFLLRQPDQFQLANALTAIPNVLASLSTSIWWTRFLLTGDLPRRWISVPAGSARYFGRAMILGFGAILSFAPGLLLARIAWSYLPNDFGKLIAFAVVLLDAGLIAFFLVRFWLVFPAIALGRQLSLAESFRLTRGAAIGLWIAVILVYVALLLPAIAIDWSLDVILRLDFPILYGWRADVIAIGLTTITSLLTLALAAASAAVTALLYRTRVPEQVSQ